MDVARLSRPEVWSLPTVNALQPYPAYKDSGVEWLGKVPENWEVLPGRTCFLEKSNNLNIGFRERTVLSLSYGSIVVKPPNKLHGLVPASFETYQIVDPFDVVVRPTDLQNDQTSLRFGLSGYRGIITSAYMCLQAHRRLAREYAYQLLHAYDLMKIFYGLGSGLRQNLSWADFRYLPCCVPPLDEQRAIARFLADADRRIRRYIRARERLIELLEEERRATIHEAVTGRIDVRTGQPYPAYKDSGVEWLGEVPEHWEVRRNTCLFRERNETGLGTLPVLEVSIREGVRIRDMDNGQRKQQILDRSQYKRAHEGDIAYNTMRMWQGAVGVVPEDGLVSPAYVVANTVGCTEPRYYGYLFRTRAYQHATKLFSRGIVSDRDRLYWDDFKRLASPAPPPSEETGIVEFLDDAVRRIRAAISATQRQIALLREYRTRLIADVVTGKLDVREAAARLPRGERDNPQAERESGDLASRHSRLEAETCQR